MTKEMERLLMSEISPSKIMDYLYEGKRLRKTHWNENSYIRKNSRGEIVNNKGRKIKNLYYGSSILRPLDKWEIYKGNEK